MEKEYGMMNNKLGKALVTLVFGCVSSVAWGHTQLGSDRVLLMNNDTNVLCSVSCQGYFDTNATQSTYWVHGAEAVPLRMRYLQLGRTHTLYRQDGTPLWHLEDCRAGSSISVVALRRNDSYIPWSTSAESITAPGVYNLSTNTTDVSGVGSVIMCNSTNACVYSPYYEDGIGAIYFDAVNAYTNAFVTLRLELATNVLDSAESNVALHSTNYDQFAWFPCPVDVLTVVKRTILGRTFRNVTVPDEPVTDITLNATEGVDNKFFRIRTNVYSFLNGYRGGIRFRIVRSDATTPSLDIDYALVDNVVASYAPTSIKLFPRSMLQDGTSDVYASANYVLLTNEVANVVDESDFNAMFVCRRQQPDLTFGDWQTNAMEFTDGTFRSLDTISLPGESSGMEYYIAMDLSVPCHVPVDFVLGTTNLTSFGIGWTEAVTHVESSHGRLTAANGTVWQYEVWNDEAVLGGGSSAFLWPGVAQSVSPFTTGSLVIPSTLGGYSVTGIGEFAFWICSGLTSVTIPSSVKDIGRCAFQGCSSLEKITLPASVRNIGTYAFCDCSGLVDITIPDAVTRIENNTFSGCSSLTNVTIPASVTSIGELAFWECSNLASVIIPASVTNIGYDAFGWCSSLTSVTVPQCVCENQAQTVFSMYTSITNVVILEGAKNTSIFYNAFEGWSGLKSITIPNTVTNIGGYAFSGCSSLTSVTIPDSVTSIGSCAFRDCIGLTNMIFKGNAPTVGWNPFDNVGSGCISYVRKSSTGWGVAIPGTWNGLNIQYLTPDVEIAVANEAGSGTVEIDGELSDTEVASGVTLVVKGENLDAETLAAKITRKPHEVGQDVSFFKVQAEPVVGGVSLAVVLDEGAVDPDATAAEIVGSESLAAFGAAAEGENVLVSLPSAKSGLYYGIAAVSDLSQMDAAAASAPLVRAGAGGVAVPVAKPAGTSAFFKVIVSDRAR